jgi:hypothetical protein
VAQYKLPPKSRLVDQQFLRIAGPDGLSIGYRFDEETCTLYGKESEVIIPSFHGMTHIAEDPVPLATTDTPGLMSAPDKARLDALSQTRIGVLGFAGAGFADDGGYLQGDIILAAGTEFISLERIGNVIRFTVDSPLPLNCGKEECAQIFWIQDETDVSAIRPPTCAGKLPDLNGYGELKIYQFPESTVVNPSDPTPVLNTKCNYPAFIFKRADDTVTPNQAEIEFVLTRNANKTTNIGWAMTPGATGVPQCVWFMGLDNDGNQIRFELNIERDPDLLGSVLYKGHTLTRQMAVVTGYTSSILSTNQYLCKFWSVNNARPAGDEFVGTNAWRYNNPENQPTDLVNPRQLVLDATCDLLPVGTLVQIWEYELSRVNGERQVQRFFSQAPKLNPATLWGVGGVIRFGDLLESRSEIEGFGTDATGNINTVNDVRLVERTQWGITGFEDRLLLADDGEVTAGTDEGQIIRSDTVLAVDTIADPDNPRPNFKITAAAAYGGATFVFNELAGRMLVFTNGPLLGVEFMVIENTTTTVTVHDPDGRGDEVLVGDGFDIYISTETQEPSGVAINNQYVADINPSIPGLVVSETLPQSDRERPVYIWHRGNHKNSYLRALIGRPDSSRFPPVDILLRAPIDNVDDQYYKVLRRGTIETGPFRGNEFIVVKGAGVGWKDLPASGALRIMTGKWRDITWEYQFKAAFDRFDDSAVMLIGFTEQFPFDLDVIPELEGTGVTGLDDATNATEIEEARMTTIPDTTTVVQLLHDDYTSPAVRLEFSVNDNTGAESVQMQIVAGLLDVSEPYQLNIGTDRSDDFVRDFRPGTKIVSRIMTQDGFITNGTETPSATPEGFRVVDGGTLPVPVDGETESWNLLEVMYRDGQIWVWWNTLLVPPDPSLSAALPTPVSVTTPYFPVDPLLEVGKMGLRLWPGSIVREVEVRDQLLSFNEFVYGQLELNGGN